MKIYTKTGDQGETGLLGGVRVPKNHVAIRACGDVDETNCHLGLALSQQGTEQLKTILTPVQTELFVIGAQIAACLKPADESAAKSSSAKGPNIEPSQIVRLEGQIDQLQEGLPALDAFILPGGSGLGAQLHISRSVCRRAERSVIELISQIERCEELDVAAIYLNRLSDLLFVLARHENAAGGSLETKWLP